MSATPDRLLCLVTMPPPVTGRTLATRRLLERLRGEFELQVRDLAPDRPTRGWWLRLSKLQRTLGAIAWLAFHRRQPRTTIYLVANHGAGLLYDNVFAALARRKRYPLVVHHHVFSYLNRRSLIFQAFLKAAPANTLHVVLCRRMQDLLRCVYAPAHTFITVPNLVEAGTGERDEGLARPRSAELVIGLLSNLTMAKGLEEVVAVHRSLAAAGISVRLRLAGPAGDAASRRYIARLLNEPAIAPIEWVGPVSGKGKVEYLRSLDVFLFPTRYRNEAQPLVLLEALAQGVPVIANDRGCIGGLVDAEVGHLASDPARFVEEATEWIAARWRSGKLRDAGLRGSAQKRAGFLSSHARQSTDELAKAIRLGGANP